MGRQLSLGVYDPGCPPHLTPPAHHRQRLGAKVRIISWYQAWGSQFSDCDGELVLEAHRCDSMPMITWEPWRLPTDLPDGNHPAHQPPFALQNIISGRYDAYIRNWARTLAATDQSIYLRPMHEMNGDWYPWAGTVNGNQPTEFCRAWRHLRLIFRQQGADNVSWVWCPYACSVPDTPQNDMAGYFPGDDEVDWLALDGYNWGTTRPWSTWQTFSQVFEPAYDRLRHLAPAKPVMIAEVGSAAKGGNKAQWVTDAFKSLDTRFRRIRALVWFDINKECDWRLTSSAEVLEAFRVQASRFT